MSPPPARVVVMTRDPVPGRVKTRLVPALGAQGAARLHAALVRHTVGVAVASGLPVVVALAGRQQGAFARRLRAMGASVQPQGRGDLGRRLARASSGAGRHVLIGTDCPGLQAQDLRRAAVARGACFGPAVDGGYWLVAIDGAPPGEPVPGHALFHDIPWSTDQVLALSLQRARQAGLPVHLLQPRADLDLPEDLAALALDPDCPDLLLPWISPCPS